MNETAADECPSSFALDDRELHGGDGPAQAPGIDRHVAGCGRCQATRAARAADLAAFDKTAPALWTRIAAGGRERRRRRRLLSIQLPALLAGLGALTLLIAGRGPVYVGPKGAAPLEIICRRAGATFALAPDDEVAPGDELRFKPRPVRPDARFINIGSVDGTGRYTSFYPPMPGARSVALPDPGQALDGSIRLDAAPGPERLLVVLSATPLAEDAVRRVAETGAAAGTIVDRIDGTPVTAAWIVLRKRAGAPSRP